MRYRDERREGHDGDFLTVGSMGHCSQIALGVAQHVPARDVYCLDGDGAVLMHMGSLAIIGTQAPPNLRHVVINNGAHDSVGGQPTAAREIDLCAVALACGYRSAESVDGVDGLPEAMERLRAATGPAMLEVRVVSRAHTDAGRPATSPVENKVDFMGELRMAADSGWEFRNPTRVVVGPGTSGRLGLRSFGRALLVTSPGATERGLTERVSRLLDTGSVLVHDRVEPNPTVDRLDSTIDALRGTPLDTIVAVGGGSVIDTAKVLGLALSTESVGVRELVAGEVPADAEPVAADRGPDHGRDGKRGDAVRNRLGHGRRAQALGRRPALFPSVALVDAADARAAWEQTVSSGLDAYVQCLEAICNRNANTVTSAFAERGLAMIPDALRTLQDDPASLEARARMAEAALLSGLAISHTSTALAHSMSYPITAHFGVPHGLACALVLPAVLEFNLEADDGRLESAAHRAGLHDAEGLLDAVVALFSELGVAELWRPTCRDGCARGDRRRDAHSGALRQQPARRRRG